MTTTQPVTPTRSTRRRFSIRRGWTALPGPVPRTAQDRHDEIQAGAMRAFLLR
ncbi:MULTISPECIES: hypothetical protein [Miniimonas]|uniref:hypothetical protein n=1 Tax=Miniimonas TaxID=947525 RepID=UPI00131F01FC|nr:MULTISPECIES: hypothetical protein [Miniimonas]